MNLLRVFTFTILLLMEVSGCAFHGVSVPEVETAGSGVFYSDSGESIQAVYRTNGTVVLSFSDGAIKVLEHAESGSGTRYVSGTDEWWEHHGEVTYSIGGKVVFVGKLRK